MLVLGHSIVRSFVHSHHSFIRLLRTARFARYACALYWAHSITRLLTSLIHSLILLLHSVIPKLVGKWEFWCLRNRLLCTIGGVNTLGRDKNKSVMNQYMTTMFFCLLSLAVYLICQQTYGWTNGCTDRQRESIRYGAARTQLGGFQYFCLMKELLTAV